MDPNLKPPRTTPVDGYDVVEQPDGIFTVKAAGKQVGETFRSFASAYMFVQRRAHRGETPSDPVSTH
jgi:hypothetical protein